MAIGSSLLCWLVPISSREGMPSFAASCAAEPVPLEELLVDELPLEELPLAVLPPEELLELDEPLLEEVPPDEPLLEELAPEELELELELVEVEPATAAAAATATVAAVGDPKFAAPATVVSDTLNFLPSAPTPMGT
jgi:hypothetical protein